MDGDAPAQKTAVPDSTSEELTKGDASVQETAKSLPTHVEPRFALVIGNNAYEHARALVNPKNDAVAIAAKLRGVGFEVTERTDATNKGMKDALREFSGKVHEGSVCLIYYAGHGVQIKGQNYLVPIDARMAAEYEVPDETLCMETVVRALAETKSKLNIFVLDCCRDDPFARSWKGSRSVGTSGGLVMPADMPQGMFVAFSTSPNKTAADGEGNNSPYAAALVEELGQPGLDFEKVFKNVGAKVVKATNGEQEPWSNSKFYGSFSFVISGGGSVNSPPVPPTSPPASPAPRMSGQDNYALMVGTSAGERKLVEVAPGVTVPFRWCPLGTFIMGSPATESQRNDNEAQIQVEITKGFWLAETECTQASWKAVIGANPSHNKANAKLPVEQVTWEDVKGFIEKLNRAGGLPMGWKWALPTEAQWEYACRAGTTSMFPSTGSVNDWGLHNMNGNVYEWCEDRYGKELLGGVDPMGAKTGAYRVYRGGSSYGKVAPCRSAARFDGGSDHRDGELGFRPALVPSR